MHTPSVKKLPVVTQEQKKKVNVTEGQSSEESGV